MRVFFIFLFSFFELFSQNNPSENYFGKLLPTINSPEQDTVFVKIIFGGDVMGHDAQIYGAWDSLLQKYDYMPCFRYIRPYIESADYAVANLEVTLGGPPYKGYPEFSSPDALARALKDSGFDLLIQANNHVLDKGKNGALRTMRVLDSFQIKHTGVFQNSHERDSLYPLILRKDGLSIAILNYTYGTNGIPEPKPLVVNYIDTTVIRVDMEKAASLHADFIIVTLHWGIEYERTQNQEQEKLAEWLIRLGADAVIGSHPHVVQPIQYKFLTLADSNDPKIIAYSLGNLISNQRSRYRDGGILVELNIAKYNGRTFLLTSAYQPVWVYRKQTTGTYKFFLVPAASDINGTENYQLLDYELEKKKLFYDDITKHLQGTRQSDFFHPFIDLR